MTFNPSISRKIFKITGADRVAFLQGLVTNDVTKDGLIYASLLTPQGKYMADFFLLNQEDAYLLDVAESRADMLVQRLNMYRLRSDVQIEPTDLKVACGIDNMPQNAFADPRHPDLGWRQYASDAETVADINWAALYVAHAVPQTDVELSDDSYILELGFERINGVDFKKGCYVGQEVTARMKHKTELKKGLALVTIDRQAPVGTQITANDKPVGTLFSQSGTKALAYLRFDRAKGDMQAGDAKITLQADT